MTSRLVRGGDGEHGRERLVRGGDSEHGRERRRDFDPIAEGRQYRLTDEVLSRIWVSVCDASGHREPGDDAMVRERFHEIAARVAARGGRLRPTWANRRASVSSCTENRTTHR